MTTTRQTQAQKMAALRRRQVEWIDSRDYTAYATPEQCVAVQAADRDYLRKIDRAIHLGIDDVWEADYLWDGEDCTECSRLNQPDSARHKIIARGKLLGRDERDN